MQIQALLKYFLIVWVPLLVFSHTANATDGRVVFDQALPSVSKETDSFDGNGPLNDYTTNNASALPDVVRNNGRYQATVLNNNNNVTLHFKKNQGRLDAKRLAFPFEFIARNIGIGTLENSQLAPSPDDLSTPPRLFMFAGIQVHVLDLDQPDSANFVVGHRGSTSYTVVGKNTVNGVSRVNDAGQGVLPAGRADLRVVGNADKSLTWYWQAPNENVGVAADDWIPYRGNGKFPGAEANFGAEVYVGLVTYAFRKSSVRFVGTSDSIEWSEGSIEPEIVQPVIAEPLIAEPVAVVTEPEIVEPEIVEPEIVEPEIVEPEIVEPEIVEPEIVEPEIVEPEIVEPQASRSGSDMFDGNGPLIDYTTNNASSLPSVVRENGRYRATLSNNQNNITLHYNKRQGRLDAKRLAFPFEFIARNIGIGTIADSQSAPAPDDYSNPSKLFMFAGIQVHVLDLNQFNSAHFVVGHRGSTSYTVEGKNTVDGVSRVNDAGQGILPSGRADLRVVGNADKSLTWYWQAPNENVGVAADDWIPYRGNGNFPGAEANFGAEVYVGLITYAFGSSSVPFVGTSDSIEWSEDF